VLSTLFARFAIFNAIRDIVDRVILSTLFARFPFSEAQAGPSFWPFNSLREILAPLPSETIHPIDTFNSLREIPLFDPLGELVLKRKAFNSLREIPVAIPRA